MAKKKLTKARVTILVRTIRSAIRKLMIDKMDFGTESFVKPSTRKLLELTQLSMNLIKIK